MATTQGMQTITLLAGEDLTAAAKQFSAVKLDSSGDVVLTEDPADIPVGILQNNPDDGQRAIVALLNGAVLKMVCGGNAIAIGAEVTTHDTVDGAIDDAGIAASDYSYGIALQTAAATAGLIIEVQSHIIQSHA